MEDLCLYQHLGCSERERYTGEEDGGTGSACARVRAHACARMMGGVGVANRGWSII